MKMTKGAKQRDPGRIKSSVLRWLGVPIGLTDEAFWSAWSGGGSSAGKTVNQRTVLQLSAAMACVRLCERQPRSHRSGEFRQLLGHSCQGRRRPLGDGSGHIRQFRRGWRARDRSPSPQDRHEGADGKRQPPGKHQHLAGLPDPRQRRRAERCCRRRSLRLLAWSRAE